jgi:hypothetical protein
MRFAQSKYRWIKFWSKLRGSNNVQYWNVSTKWNVQFSIIQKLYTHAVICSHREYTKAIMKIYDVSSTHIVHIRSTSMTDRGTQLMTTSTMAVSHNMFTPYITRCMTCTSVTHCIWSCRADISHHSTRITNKLYTNLWTCRLHILKPQFVYDAYPTPSLTQNAVIK